MRVLIICSGNVPNFEVEKNQAFVYDQVQALKGLDSKIRIEYFFVKEKGLSGYLKSFKRLRKEIKTYKYDIIHAHYALSGLLANLQRTIPVVTTFHGSDINNIELRIFALVAELLSKRTIYVSDKLIKKAIYNVEKKNEVIPCGVDFSTFYIKNKKELRKQLMFDENKKYILFSSSFDNINKNYALLKGAIQLIDKYDIEVLQLKDLKRAEVSDLMNAVDLCVMTSFKEGSPQFIKEALASNCPVVSTNVGDVEIVISGIEGCFLSAYNELDLAEKILKVFLENKRINSRDKISYLDNVIIAKRINKLYNSIIE